MQHKRPRVSIGMPVYNGEKYIHTALDSLLSQTFTEFELIISDNASTDRTWQILQEYAKKDHRIALYRQEENMEAMKNFEFVLHKACSSYFLWAADDDYRANNYISALLELFEQHEGASLAGSTVVNIEADGSLTETGDFDDNINHLNGRTRICALLEAHRTAWIYGVYKTDFLKNSFPQYLMNPIVASDRLFLYYCLFNNRIVATNQTVIYKRAKPKGPNYGYRPKKILPYILWSIRFLIKALIILWKAKLTAWNKLYITPFFIRKLGQLLYSYSLLDVIRSRLKAPRLKATDSQ